MNTGSRPADGGTALAPLLTLAIALALAACGSNSASTVTSAARPAATVTSGTSGATVKIPKYVAADNVRKDVSATGCAPAGRRGWRLNGTATNPMSSSRAYSIVVDFVTVKGNTVLDTKILTVGPIAPKTAAGWSVTGAAGQRHVTCVIRQALSR